jgi:hypothetical protein
MAYTENVLVEQLQAQRYTVQNKLSSVRTRLKGIPSAEKRHEYEERQTSLLAERDRLAEQIKALEAK